MSYLTTLSILDFMHFGLLLLGTFAIVSVAWKKKEHSVTGEQREGYPGLKKIYTLILMTVISAFALGFITGIEWRGKISPSSIVETPGNIPSGGAGAPR